jgi:multiple sugar transport system substrate-binding protein
MVGRIRRTGVITAVLLFFAVGLAACGGSSTKSGPVTLTQWSFNQQVTEQAAKFNATHPDIHVNALKHASGPGQYYPPLITAIQAGNGPDVFILEYQEIAQLASSNALLDLNSKGLTGNNEQSQFDAATWNLSHFGGKLIGLPQDTGPTVMFWNTDTFKKAGITTAPKTWDEYYTDAVKIHALGAKYHIAALGLDNSGYIEALFWQAGAIWTSIQGDTWHVNINSDKAKTVAQYWDKMINQGLVDTKNTDFSAQWNANLDNGTIASWPMAAGWGTGVISGAAKDQAGKWAVATTPQWTAGNDDQALWGGSAQAISATTKHPKEAFTYLQWYLENVDSYTIGVNEIGEVTADLQARQLPFFTQPNAYFSNQVIGQTIFDPNAKVDPSWVFPTNLTTLNSDEANDFPAAVAAHQSLTTALDKLQQQELNDLKSQGINAVAGP